MKNRYFISIAMAIGFSPLVGISQEWQLQASEAEQEVTRSYPLEITTNKTASLIFPAVIKSVDKGSRDVLAQKAKDVSNVLHVKAAKENFEETNLTVITGDGVLHHFTVRYTQDPSCLTFDMAEIASQSSNGVPPSDRSSKLLFSSEVTEGQIEDYCETLTHSRRVVHFKRKAGDKVSLALLGIYVKANVMFYRVRIRNNSNIGYDIDFLKFYVRDNARIKRTASQEVEAVAMYRHGDASSVRGKSQTEIVYALPKFTIPDSKHLAIELLEKNGGRHYVLRVKNRSIVRARVLG